MTETIWGALFVGYILIAAVPLLARAGEDDGRDTAAGRRFERFSLAWTAGLVALVIAYALLH